MDKVVVYVGKIYIFFLIYVERSSAITLAFKISAIAFDRPFSSHPSDSYRNLIELRDDAALYNQVNAHIIKLTYKKARGCANLSRESLDKRVAPIKVITSLRHCLHWH